MAQSLRSLLLDAVLLPCSSHGTLLCAECAQVTTPQGYSLDAVVRVGDRDVAVEVDGPSHFLGRVPTGATQLKRRQLRAFGWSLVDVPYWEWNALNGDQERAAYLRRKLDAAHPGRCPVTDDTSKLNN